MSDLTQALTRLATTQSTEQIAQIELFLVKYISEEEPFSELLELCTSSKDTQLSALLYFKNTLQKCPIIDNLSSDRRPDLICKIKDLLFKHLTLLSQKGAQYSAPLVQQLILIVARLFGKLAQSSLDVYFIQLQQFLNRLLVKFTQAAYREALVMLQILRYSTSASKLNFTGAFFNKLDTQNKVTFAHQTQRLFVECYQTMLKVISEVQIDAHQDISPIEKVLSKIWKLTFLRFTQNFAFCEEVLLITVSASEMLSKLKKDESSKNLLLLLHTINGLRAVLSRASDYLEKGKRLRMMASIADYFLESTFQDENLFFKILQGVQNYPVFQKALFLYKSEGISLIQKILTDPDNWPEEPFLAQPDVPPKEDNPLWSLFTPEKRIQILKFTLLHFVVHEAGTEQDADNEEDWYLRFHCWSTVAGQTLRERSGVMVRRVSEKFPETSRDFAQLLIREEFGYVQTVFQREALLFFLEQTCEMNELPSHLRDDLSYILQFQLQQDVKSFDQSALNARVLSCCIKLTESMGMDQMHDAIEGLLLEILAFLRRHEAQQVLQLAGVDYFLSFFNDTSLPLYRFIHVIPTVMQLVLKLFLNCQLPQTSNNVLLLLRVIAESFKDQDSLSFESVGPVLVETWNVWKEKLPHIQDLGQKRKLLLNFFKLVNLVIPRLTILQDFLKDFFCGVLDFGLSHIEPNFAQEVASLWILLVRKLRAPLPFLHHCQALIINLDSPQLAILVIQQYFSFVPQSPLIEQATPISQSEDQEEDKHIQSENTTTISSGILFPTDTLQILNKLELSPSSVQQQIEDTLLVGLAEYFAKNLSLEVQPHFTNLLDYYMLISGRIPSKAYAPYFRYLVNSFIQESQSVLSTETPQLARCIIQLGIRAQTILNDVQSFVQSLATIVSENVGNSADEQLHATKQLCYELVIQLLGDITNAQKYLLKSGLIFGCSLGVAVLEENQEVEEKLKKCILTHDSLIEFHGEDIPESAPCPSHQSRQHWLGRANQQVRQTQFEWVAAESGLQSNKVKDVRDQLLHGSLTSFITKNMWEYLQSLFN